MIVQLLLNWYSILILLDTSQLVAEATLTYVWLASTGPCNYPNDGEGRRRTANDGEWHTLNYLEY